MSEYLKTMIKKQKMHTLAPTSGPSCPSDKFVVLSIILQAGEQAEVLVAFSDYNTKVIEIRTARVTAYWHKLCPTFK